MKRTLLVVGCGSIGTRHLRNLRRLRAGRLLATDLDAARRRDAATSGAEPVASLEAGLAESPDAVFVCTPPSDHVPTGLSALRAGAHVFVEKPISHDLAAAGRLVSEARRRRRILRVGYSLRFEAGLRALADLVHDGRLGTPVGAVVEFGQYLPDWRPAHDYRRDYTARRALGGGILLDASHEFDALRWILGEVAGVYCRARTPPHLAADAEGIADLVCRLASGVSAAVHLDFVQHGYERRCKVVGTRATALWDFGRRQLVVRSAGPPRPRVRPLAPDANTMYLAEARDFLGALAGRRDRLVDGADAVRTLRVALAARRSSDSGREVRP